MKHVIYLAILAITNIELNASDAGEGTLAQAESLQERTEITQSPSEEAFLELIPDLIIISRADSGTHPIWRSKALNKAPLQINVDQVFGQALNKALDQNKNQICCVDLFPSISDITFRLAHIDIFIIFEEGKPPELLSSMNDPSILNRTARDLGFTQDGMDNGTLKFVINVSVIANPG